MVSMNVNSCNLCTSIKWNIYSSAQYVSEPFDIKGFILLWVETFCIVNSGFLPQHFPPHMHVQGCVQVPISLIMGTYQSWLFSLVHTDAASLPPRVLMLNVALLCLTYPGLLLARLYDRQQNTWLLNTLSGQAGEEVHFLYCSPTLGVHFADE